LVAGIRNEYQYATVGQPQKIIVVAAGPTARRVVHRDLPTVDLGYLAWQQAALKLAESLKLPL
jgi:hypothetical protein